MAPKVGGNKQPWPSSRHYTDIFLRGLRNTTEGTKQGRPVSRPDLSDTRQAFRLDPNCSKIIVYWLNIVVCQLSSGDYLVQRD
jgi:hypothetical protein